MVNDSNAMVEFFWQLGYQTFQTESSWWYEVKSRVLMSLPYYKLIKPEQELCFEIAARKYEKVFESAAKKSRKAN